LNLSFSQAIQQMDSWLYYFYLPLVFDS